MERDKQKIMRERKCKRKTEKEIRTAKEREE